MKATRRAFLKTSAGAGFAVAGAVDAPAAERQGPDKVALDRILAEPVLRRDLVKAPVKVDALEGG
jgi:hypothetical protein